MGVEILFDNLLSFRGDLERNPDDKSLKFMSFCMEHLSQSHAQLFQDLFVQFTLRSKSRGFFVEFGATNGVSLSNTYLLERNFKWKGILAEPAKCWHGELHANRKCKIDTRCVWSSTGEKLTFSETEVAEFSTVSDLSEKDFNREMRRNPKQYEVETISLNDLLANHEAPKHIDYMSLDTEGSELRILKSLDFVRYEPKIITVEHNYTADREEIRLLLSVMGYVRVFDMFSKWDDWYVRSNLL
jgi:FkbM family methyltransferase